MRVVVTGGGGMLGAAVCLELARRGHVSHAFDIRPPCQYMDVTDPRSVSDSLEHASPDVVVHCAAYTAVDKAEAEHAAAYRLNALGSWIPAAECARRGIPIISISTDYVFDGRAGRAYLEYDTPNPLSVYGRTKLAGEVAVRQVAREHWIVRTAWLFGTGGRCFPDSMLRLAASSTRLRVVADQVGSPTYAPDLAGLLVEILERRPPYGTYHAVNSGDASWYDLARAALGMAGLDADTVCPIATCDWPTMAVRPRYAPLQCDALRVSGLSEMRPWRHALADFIAVRSMGDSR